MRNAMDKEALRSIYGRVARRLIVSTGISRPERISVGGHCWSVKRCTLATKCLIVAQAQVRPACLP